LPYTDLHSHILPGFDDGARDEGQFLEMATIAVAGGTSRIVATPHCDLESTQLDLDEVSTSVAEHSALLASKGMQLELLCGAEVRINAGLFVLAEDGGGSLARLGIGDVRKFLLVDLPLFDLPVPTHEALFRIQLSGMTPILAHPERNRYLIRHPSIVREMVERGIELQVNSGSLEGIYGRHARQSALALIQEGAARLIASDAHQPNGRGPDLSGAATIVERRLGSEAAGIMFQLNPDRVIQGEDLTPAVKAGVRKSPHRLFSLFSR
jgi:protein-tyrosine phosphatase